MGMDKKQKPCNSLLVLRSTGGSNNEMPAIGMIQLAVETFAELPFLAALGV